MTCKWGRHCNNDNPAPFPKWVVKSRGSIVFESKVCLKGLSDSRANTMVQLYGDYCKQILPFAGGSMDQPNYYTESMRIIDGHINGEEQ